MAKTKVTKVSAQEFLSMAKKVKSALVTVFKPFSGKQAVSYSADNVEPFATFVTTDEARALVSSISTKQIKVLYA